MPWQGFGRTIRTVGIVGSGQIGPDIALYFSKALSPLGVRVIVNDVSPAALEAGQAKLRKKIEKGVETKAFKTEQAKQMLEAVQFSAEKGDLGSADYVIEAATEDLNIKRKIFADLEPRVSAETILASNSSHLEPEVIFEGLRDPSRTMVNHYFFPAERNPVVEVVPGRATSEAATAFAMNFYEAIGKVPIRVGSRYGYAIDPIFEGLFLAALLISDSGLATPKQIDTVAQKVLGLGIGPFTAMNLTGGTPLTRVGLKHYHEKIMPWFHVPVSMETRTEPWPAPERAETVEVDPKTFEEVAKRLKGAYFGLVGEILESGISTVSDLEMAVDLALVMKPPFQMMNETGVGESLRLVEAYAKDQRGFKVSSCLRRGGPWEIPFIHRRNEGDVAVLTVRRPKTLNALSRGIYQEIRRTFEALKQDDTVRAVVLTGFGTKAFVSGADIGMLASIRSVEEGRAVSWESQEAVLAVERVGKPVVCALNGLALGGGSELAMGCSVRIARKGLPICFGQPEPKLGIIPGDGGTQRLPRIIGFDKAWEILRTGRTVSGAEALKLGYISEEVEGDLTARAVVLARELAGSGKRPRIREEPLPIPDQLPQVDIGPLSRAVDSILIRAIREGCALPLEEGLRFESACFGDVCGTKDMRIGLENFVKTQLKQPAPFVHG